MYDAKTGLPLGGSTKSAPQPLKPGRSIDGFSKQSPKKIPITKADIKAPQLQKKYAPLSQAKSRTTPGNIKRSVSRSTTLNRSAVKAPIKKSAPKTVAPEVKTPSVTSSATKHADPTRLERAQKVTKSATIGRFYAQSNVQPATTPKPSAAQNLTNQLEKTHSQAKPAEAKNSSDLSTKERLLKNAVGKAAIGTPTKKAAKTKNYRSSRSKIGKFATSGLVAVILAGYVAYLNVPSISMKVAAHRAGFDAAMPAYKPAGYSLSGPIAYNPGQVTVNFSSNTDDRKFSLKQQPTTWDSTALLENFVTKQTPNYLTYQDRGLTIYIYDGSSAAWVNGGKLYNLQGDNSQLDTDQLLKLATSV